MPAPPFLTSVAGSGTAQYLADQYGAPYLLRWDSIWGLIVNAGNSGDPTTWQSDMDNYCSIRAGQGFNGDRHERRRADVGRGAAVHLAGGAE